MKIERKPKRQENCRFSLPKKNFAFRLHPLFIAVGIFYTLKGELFLFLMSCLIAVQHECAHAFAAARLGYRLNKIVLMPFGAVIDGDMRGLALKDEIIIALWGPLCNLLTAVFFACLWWFAPTMYAFTDTACFSSLSIAVVNLLPAYPLDGGRMLRCALVKAFTKTADGEEKAVEKAEKITRTITLVFALALTIVFIIQAIEKDINFSVIAFALFLFFGVFSGNKDGAKYERMDFSCTPLLRRGADVKKVAVLCSCPIKNTFRFLTRGYYLILEVYDEKERRLFELSQNQLSLFFTEAKSPYEPIGEIWMRIIQKRSKSG